MGLRLNLKEQNMNWMRTTLISASLLTALAGMAQAQPGPGSMDGPMHGNPAMSQKMRERMAERHTKHLAELKTKLKLDAQQEASWKTFAEAMQPPADSTGWPDRAAMSKLSTPERIDQMQAWHSRMDTEMKKRGDATKNFYAGLNADQKKVFDSETGRFMAGGMGRHMHHPR